MSILKHYPQLEERLKDYDELLMIAVVMEKYITDGSPEWAAKGKRVLAELDRISERACAAESQVLN